MVAYLERKTGTCRPKTVTALATRLNHFGLFLTDTDPTLISFNGLDRRRHIEPYLNSVAGASSSKTGLPLTIADQDRRIRAVDHMLVEIGEWGWDDAPPRRLIFRSDHPRLPKPLPATFPSTLIVDSLPRWKHRRIGCRLTPCSLPGRSGSVSVNSSISNSTACTTSPGTDHG
ncbi:MAG: hypothetical protein R2733_01825 [Acidimicrobiales bacterium]